MMVGGVGAISKTQTTKILLHRKGYGIELLILCYFTLFKSFSTCTAFDYAQISLGLLYRKQCGIWKNNSGFDRNLYYLEYAHSMDHASSKFVVVGV